MVNRAGGLVFRVLGPVEVVAGERAVGLGSAQVRLVLAALLADANVLVSTDRLVEALWGDEPPAKAASSVRKLVYRLRSLLGRGADELVVTRAPGYVVRVSQETFDAARFEGLVSRARDVLRVGDPATALRLLDDALGLWRGPAFGEFASAEFARVHAARLEELRWVATEDRVEARLALGAHEEQVGELETLLVESPFRERLWGELMLALYRSGRQAEALRAYGRVRSLLGQELGIEPGLALRSLEEAMLLQKTELDWAPVREFAPIGTVDAFPRNNLPRPGTTFVGREAEIASVAELVCQSSLVTLTGVGGVGKTRLALQVAAEVLGEFPDGVWWCEFAPVTDPAAIWEALATNLPVQSLPGRALDVSVLDFLATKQLLLVLDNCEHLLDPVARLVDAIEQRCVRVSVLATSREGLGLAGERMVAVPPLGVPAADAAGDDVRQAEAVCLFRDRASAAKRDFALTDRNVGAVGVLCRRLDGIPLAIELAAARVRSLSPEDLVARLDQRFKLLTRGSRAALERHQTLRNTIDWSYDLLTPIERHALQRLSVFAGGCDLGAAEAVLPDDDLDAAEVVDVLGQLVDKSLVVVADTDRGVRYRLLETIRQYARERLDASGDPIALRRRHADHYVALAETAGPHLRAREHLEWTSVVTLDIDNFRAALDWAAETPSPAHALRLVAPLAVHGRPRELTLDWAATALAIPGGDGHPLVPEVAAWAALSATLARDFAQAEDVLGVAERAQAALGVRLTSVAVVRTTLAHFRDDFEEARRHGEELVELARASGDPYELAVALITLGGALHSAETLDAAVATTEESVRVARAAGIDTTLVSGLSNLAMWLPYDESERALTLLDEAIEVSTRIGDRLDVAYATGIKAEIAARHGDWRTALQVSVDAAEQVLALGAHQYMIRPLYWAGVALCALGSYEPAAVVLGNPNAMTERWLPDWITEIGVATDCTLRETLGQHVATLTARGADLDITDAVAYLHAEADLTLAVP